MFFWELCLTSVTSVHHDFSSHFFGDFVTEFDVKFQSLLVFQFGVTLVTIKGNNFGTMSLVNFQAPSRTKGSVTIVTFGTFPDLNLRCWNGFLWFLLTLIFMSLETTFIPKNLVTFVTFKLACIVRDIDVPCQIIFTLKMSVTLVTFVLVFGLQLLQTCHRSSRHALEFGRLYNWTFGLFGMFHGHVSFETRFSSEFSVAFGTRSLIILGHFGECSRCRRSAKVNKLNQ